MIWIEGGEDVSLSQMNDEPFLHGWDAAWHSVVAKGSSFILYLSYLSYLYTCTTRNTISPHPNQQITTYCT